MDTTYDAVPTTLRRAHASSYLSTTRMFKNYGKRLTSYHKCAVDFITHALWKKRSKPMHPSGLRLGRERTLFMGVALSQKWPQKNEYVL